MSIPALVRDIIYLDINELGRATQPQRTLWGKPSRINSENYSPVIHALRARPEVGLEDREFFFLTSGQFDT